MRAAKHAAGVVCCGLLIDFVVAPISWNPHCLAYHRSPDLPNLQFHAVVRPGTPRSYHTIPPAHSWAANNTTLPLSKCVKVVVVTTGKFARTDVQPT
ncbi:hypothetical protein PCANC_23721 [Puccinia coronata f. sp. avenae]|uniref:Uncharacterized protein n=1 Tax=Puccinia coronata f. sp. avenae TaxID=200324 RepID=A0A2N5V3C2_9BASI|nr:hypothetical protein PCANC_23721 [Puccinia coronata f. sp. avenae]PLW44498.1 hypothetical protein PCASD_11487 [Puccinia coronata f. sp. avenae]